ncbi:hypothetical protein BMS3Abin15_00267 [bacterium BMS3Abin15]|nr:hypothetical protein BMS3Abin15_00267 [bacterium BMS3Abin15]HDZ85716.1 hypothetical protein [Candidatus Moranbacteria bacterium]
MKKRTKISFWLLGLFVASTITHNIIYGVFKFEEPIFFILSLIFALGFMILFAYNIVIYLKEVFEYLKSRRE